ncbi:hypothetical protein [Pelosinus baikalensis]|uniref:Uncharacterized protein n=1 Tax=Pelosinus baikalensis TaxID=2892015 RepID=A0ABS8HR28_9FIRM|nr:hypothetical protein [Pelosinus baikalensis]MCC5464708.1 hypothetical protein [Pelosinus baikalensis]
MNCARFFVQQGGGAAHIGHMQGDDNEAGREILRQEHHGFRLGGLLVNAPWSITDQGALYIHGCLFKC